jgi:hypothetical protein
VDGQEAAAELPGRIADEPVVVSQLPPGGGRCCTKEHLGTSFRPEVGPECESVLFGFARTGSDIEAPLVVPVTTSFLCDLCVSVVSEKQPWKRCR